MLGIFDSQRCLFSDCVLLAFLHSGCITKNQDHQVQVVTGANKGIGLEICKQLASKGIVVVLTARDENRGKEALDHFKGSGLSDFVVFHKLDVVDPTSVATLADFVKTQFGKLDILVNNAGISGSSTDPEALKATMNNEVRPEEIISKWKDVLIENYELAVECLETNYFGVKRMVEAFIPLLQLSNSPRIVNVSSSMGKLKNVKNEWAKQIFTDVENLSEERVDEVVNEFLKDYKEGTHKAKGWPDSFSAYTISKAAMNAYTRNLAKKYPTFCINCVCPGFVKTDMSQNMGILSVEQGAETPVKMALLPDGGPTGLFFDRNGVSSFE